MTLHKRQDSIQLHYTKTRQDKRSPIRDTIQKTREEYTRQQKRDIGQYIIQDKTPVKKLKKKEKDKKKR